jgi:hypothetical protein
MSTNLQKRLLGALLWIVCTGACNAKSDHAAPAPSGSPHAPALSPPSAAAAPVLSAAPPPHTLTGTWEGRYEAKRAKVELSGKLKDHVRASDDGRLGIGAGTIAITIADAREVAGKVKGALGDATVIGQIDGDNIHAAISPDDPNAPLAMTGWFDGMLQDGRIHASIRASNVDATIVREANVVMQKQASITPASGSRPAGASTSSTR